MAHEGRSGMHELYVMFEFNGRQAAEAVKHFNMSPYQFKSMSVSTLTLPYVHVHKLPISLYPFSASHTAREEEQEKYV